MGRAEEQRYSPSVHVQESPRPTIKMPSTQAILLAKPNPTPRKD